MGLGDLIDEVGDFVAAFGELIHDKAAVESVQKALKEIIATMDEDTFEYMATIQETSFGTTTSATSLAFHHGLAQQVMFETMQGLKKDMQDFLVNVTKASELISITDENSAADVRKRNELIDALHNLDSHSHEDSAHNHARNHQHGPWPTSPSSNGGGR